MGNIAQWNHHSSLIEEMVHICEHSEHMRYRSSYIEGDFCLFISRITNSKAAGACFAVKYNKGCSCYGCECIGIHALVSLATFLSRLNIDSETSNLY
jgi:hypothetical protein